MSSSGVRCPAVRSSRSVAGAPLADRPRWCAAPGRTGAVPPADLPMGVGLDVEQFEHVAGVISRSRAALGGDDQRAAVERCGWPPARRHVLARRSHIDRSRANPVGSRVTGQTSATRCRRRNVLRISQPRPGRMTSAQTAVISRPDNAVRRQVGGRSRSARSQPVGSCAPARPAASAPLVACQRSCQVGPGWSASQSSSAVSPLAAHVSAVRFVRHERCPGQPLATPAHGRPGGGPVQPGDPGRAGRRGPLPAPRLATRPAGNPHRRRRDTVDQAPVPNSTCIVSGRYRAPVSA